MQARYDDFLQYLLRITKKVLLTQKDDRLLIFLAVVQSLHDLHHNYYS